MVSLNIRPVMSSAQRIKQRAARMRHQTGSVRRNDYLQIAAIALLTQPVPAAEPDAVASPPLTPRHLIARPAGDSRDCKGGAGERLSHVRIHSRRREERRVPDETQSSTQGDGAKCRSSLENIFHGARFCAAWA